MRRCRALTRLSADALADGGGGMCPNGGVYANGVCLPPGQQYYGNPYGGGYMVRVL